MKLCTPNHLLWQIKTITGFVVLNILFVSPTVAQTKSDLPPRILELVPSGTVLTSQDFTSSPTIAVANFTAEKNVAIGRISPLGDDRKRRQTVLRAAPAPC